MDLEAGGGILGLQDGHFHMSPQPGHRGNIGGGRVQVGLGGDGGPGRMGVGKTRHQDALVIPLGKDPVAVLHVGHIDGAAGGGCVVQGEGVDGAAPVRRPQQSSGLSWPAAQAAAEMGVDGGAQPNGLITVHPGPAGGVFRRGKGVIHRATSFCMAENGRTCLQEQDTASGPPVTGRQAGLFAGRVACLFQGANWKKKGRAGPFRLT